jgi:FdrA protein
MSFVASRVRKNAYFDSVRLMRISTSLQSMAGVLDAALMMGTKQNKEFLKRTNLLTEEVEAARSNDLFLVVEAESREQADQALARAEGMLEVVNSRDTRLSSETYYSLESALRKFSANLALLSIPGPYVEREAMKCLEKKLHLFIFSDHVPVAAEQAIKERAKRSGLLVMGPDCGTAIIHRVALGFANAVRPGSIGLVGASGTGLQEISCLIDHLGSGISHAIGTGSHDISDEIGGMTMLQAIEMFIHDAQTQVIVVVSKPPSRRVAVEVLQRLEAGRKPSVVNFLGTYEKGRMGHIHFADTMEGAALAAVSLGGGCRSEFLETTSLWEQARQRAFQLREEQRFVRGIYNGGTFAIESASLLSRWLGTIHTNTVAGEKLHDPGKSIAHTCVDLGDAFFTSGRPHPMIEPSIRNRRIVSEMQDRQTAVLLLDVVLGYGAHPDPAGELILALRQIQQSSQNPSVSVIVSVCGTDRDPQNRSKQVAKLREVGALVFPSNASAARAAAYIATRGKIELEG